jgi:anti-anti-sigma factor
MAEVRTVATSDDISHVALSGRLDIEGVGKVELPLTSATVSQRKPVVLDMSGVEFLGSLGIGLLVRCAVSLQRSGARFVLFGCQPPVKKSLEITKVNAVLSMADSEAAALKLLAQP